MYRFPKIYRWWTKEDLEWLRTEGPKHTKREIAQALGRSRAAITNQMHKYGLRWTNDERSLRAIRKTHSTWTPEHIEFLRQNAGKVPLEELAEKTGKTVVAVLVYAKAKLRIHTRFHGRFWTKEEDNVLVWEGDKVTAKELARRLNRSEHAILCRLQQKGIRSLSSNISIRQAERRTGYCKSQLITARKALGQHWKRLDHNRSVRKNGDIRKGTFSISEEQLAACCEWLRKRTQGHGDRLPQRRRRQSAVA